MTAHSDHPMRHWDRTCPACNPDADRGTAHSETTLCWKCRKGYAMSAAKCPHCQATNANEDFDAVQREINAAHSSQASAPSEGGGNADTEVRASLSDGTSPGKDLPPARPALRVGDVVQLIPGVVGNPMLGGCFMTVTEPKSWGAQGYVQSLGTDGKMGGQAYYRAKWEDMTAAIGQAEYTVDES